MREKKIEGEIERERIYMKQNMNFTYLLRHYKLFRASALLICLCKIYVLVARLIDISTKFFNYINTHWYGDLKLELKKIMFQTN